MYTLKLFRSELWELSVICFNWRHVNCIPCKQQQNLFYQTEVLRIEYWLCSKSSAMESFVMMSSSDSMVIGYLSCVLLQAAPWESQHITVALITLSVLTPYTIWISFKIYLFLVLKWNAFHRPNNKESIVSCQGNSSRMCLKHNTRR